MGGLVLAALILTVLAAKPVGSLSAPMVQEPVATPTPEPGLFRSYRVLVPPTVDGSLADWPVQGGILLNTDTASRVFGTVDDHDDASVICWSQWDENTLYVACSVADDILVADSGAIVWQDDIVELSFDGKNDDIRFCGGAYCSDDHKYELRVDGSITDETNPPNPGVVGAVATGPNGYEVEIALPQEEFDSGALVSGQLLGFNLGLVDDDDGGTSEAHLIWMGESTYSQPENFGEVILDPEPGQGFPTPTPTPTQMIDLDNATPIGCQQRTTGDTVGAASNVQTYGCVPYWLEAGPEHVYALDLDDVTDLDAVLTNMASDLDLFVLTGASPDTCIGYGDNSASLQGLAPGIYYLVIDGYEGASGGYQLDVWCPLEPTPVQTPTSTPPRHQLYLPVLIAH
jgi:hypothetical protein